LENGKKDTQSRLFFLVTSATTFSSWYQISRKIGKRKKKKGGKKKAACPYSIKAKIFTHLGPRK
jgi:hypothetical protein